MAGNIADDGREKISHTTHTRVLQSLTTWKVCE